MSTERELRIKYNNDWPKKFLFPAEEQFNLQLAKNNLQQVFVPVQLVYSDNTEFQSFLSHLIEALDQLPYRPDMSFDLIWKALDAEFFRLQEESSAPKNVSRFDTFCKKIVSDASTCKAFYSLIEIIPMQTCEWAAKRVLESNLNPKDYSKQFLQRVRPILTKPFYDAFVNKYLTDYQVNSASTQRSAGAFLRKAMFGENMTINGAVFTLSKQQSVNFLIAVVMAQFRNERFHGATIPPFRSSAARLKTYAHSYFLFLVAYTLLIEVFLYREFKVLNSNDALLSVEENKKNYISIFGKVLKD